MREVIITLIIVFIILVTCHLYYAKKYLTGLWESTPEFEALGYFVVCINEDHTNCLFLVKNEEGEKIYEDYIEMTVSALTIPTLDGFRASVTFSGEVLPFNDLAQCEMHLNKDTGTLALTKDDEIILVLIKNLMASNAA